MSADKCNTLCIASTFICHVDSIYNRPTIQYIMQKKEVTAINSNLVPQQYQRQITALIIVTMSRLDIEISTVMYTAYSYALTQ